MLVFGTRTKRGDIGVRMPALVFVVGALLLAACSSQDLINSSESAYEGTWLSGEATDFTLTDQNNVEISLSDFRGQVVVLTFMDSQCKEVCPATASHLRAANVALREEAAQAVFLAVNVNTEANAVEDVAIATEKWRLNEIHSWHFLTGNKELLESVWTDYGIGVVLPEKEGDELIHTPGVFLIDQTGQKRWYISTALDDPNSAHWITPLSELLVTHIEELLREE